MARRPRQKKPRRKQPTSQFWLAPDGEVDLAGTKAHSLPILLLHHEVTALVDLLRDALAPLP